MRWYFDFISPFACLAWPRVRALMRGHPVELRPILFAALLDRNAHKGPAEIAGKREFTYRHVLWRARQAGMPMRFPPGHPFNPLAALADGVFGVPTLVVHGQPFWGEDAMDFALAVLENPGLLEEEELRRVASLPVAQSRI